MIQLTREQAIQIGESEIWKNWSPEKVVGFQLYQDCLCMDFHYFHGCVEKVLERPVFTHEFAYPEHLQAEFEGKKGKPDLEAIFNLIPKDKLIVVVKE